MSSAAVRVTGARLWLERQCFIHYGVGNLFFDQMQARNLRENFIDRYLVYNNRLLGAELLATIRDESHRRAR